MTIKEELSKLKQVDLYSLMLFVVYQLKNLPEYSALSELAYVLDKDNFLKLCEYFGGLTITIPTIEELELILHALVLYQNVNIDRMDFDKACQDLHLEITKLRAVKNVYYKVVEVLETYEFKTRTE